MLVNKQFILRKSYSAGVSLYDPTKDKIYQFKGPISVFLLSIRDQLFFDTLNPNEEVVDQIIMRMKKVDSKLTEEELKPIHISKALKYMVEIGFLIE